MVSIRRSKIFFKRKIKNILFELGIIKYYRKKIFDKTRSFKKSINNGSITLTEEFNLPQVPDKFINEGDSDYILYFFDGIHTKNFIFFNPNHEFFPLNLVELISLLITHGSKDDNENSQQKRVKIIGSRPLSLTCGESSTFVHKILTDLNIKSRLVLTLTNDDWNTYDNGHTMLEFYSKKLNKWILYDVDLKNTFSNKTIIMSLWELINSNNFEVIPTSNHPFLDYSGYEKYFLIGEFIKLNQLDWYKRVFHFFSIFDSKRKKFIFNINRPLDEKKILEYFEGSCLCINSKKFEEVFYL